MALSKTIFAMIPARYGSTRLKMKNLALINDKPMISYAISAAKQSGVFDSVVVNSEHRVFQSIADRYECDFYLRPDYLGSSDAKSDSVVFDFMQKFSEAEIVAWVNPIAPFQTHDEIREIISYFVEKDLDSLITVENKKVHCLYNSVPVNYQRNQIFSQTQDLKPVQQFVYSLMIWKSHTFKIEYKKHGYALFCGNFDVYPVRKNSEIIIKTAHDLILADTLMRSLERSPNTQLIRYDQIVEKF